MKKTLFVIFSLILLGVFCAKQEAPGIRLSPPKWTDNEVNQYQVLVGGQPSGSYIMSIRLSQIGADSTIELSALTYIKVASGETRDSSWMVLRRDNLRPIKSVKVLNTHGVTLSSEVTYSRDKAAIKAKIPSGEKSVDIPIGINHFDNDEITTLLRALELKPDEEKELNTVTGLGGTSIPVKIKITGEEKLTVPAGEFECNKYQMTLAGRAIEVFYEKTGMKRMVKYHDTVANMIMELVPRGAAEEKKPKKK